MSDAGWEAPTLAGRALCDMGRQLVAARARAEAAEAERDHYAEQLGLVYWHVTGGLLSKPYDFKDVESQIDDCLNAFYAQDAQK